MDNIFLTGLIGSLILVSGAAYPAKPVKHPAKSTKNWLFAIGGTCMFAYSLLNFSAGGQIFFVILQLLVIVSSVLMMLDTNDRFDAAIITIASITLIIWSLTLFEDYSTIIFILGLTGIGMGYTMENGTMKRNLFLTIGSILIALFSYLVINWIFFWLNVFFAVFSGYYALKLMPGKSRAT